MTYDEEEAAIAALKDIVMGALPPFEGEGGAEAAVYALLEAAIAVGYDHCGQNEFALNFFIEAAHGVANTFER